MLFIFNPSNSDLLSSVNGRSGCTDYFEDGGKRHQQPTVGGCLRYLRHRQMSQTFQPLTHDIDI